MIMGGIEAIQRMRSFCPNLPRAYKAYYTVWNIEAVTKDKGLILTSVINESV